MTYYLLCYKNNSSSIIDWIRRKDGLKYNNVNNSTHYDLLSIVYQCFWIWGKDGLKYKM